MNFRRSPFQFSTTDPLERQRELEKRFGLPSNRKMYVDLSNPLSTGSTAKETCSPRLQHRVPIFTEGSHHPVHSSVDSTSLVPESKKPKVRVIPIEIEESESRPVRHRNFSGPVLTSKENDESPISRSDLSSLKQHSRDFSKLKQNTGPRVLNIPIQVEDASNLSKNQKVDTAPKFKNDFPRVFNGCTVSKSHNEVQPMVKEIKVIRETDKSQEGDQQKIDLVNLLKKIEDILVEFKTYETGVLEFSGTSKDKQYRYLDEMLTRCMLRLDDIDTMGNENVRLARKNAVKKIQASIDLLESKANATDGNGIKVPEMDESIEDTDVKNEIVDKDIKNHDGQIEHIKSLPSEEMLPVDETNAPSDHVDTQQNELAIEENDVEMQDEAGLKSQLTEVTCPTSVTIDEDKSIVKGEGCQAEVDKTIKVSEMDEIQASSSTDLTVRCDVEMLDNSDCLNTKSDIIPGEENITNVIEKDVEMQDIQSAPNVTANVSTENTKCVIDQCNEQNYTKCNSSKTEDQDNKEMEILTCTSDAIEKLNLS